MGTIVHKKKKGGGKEGMTPPGPEANYLAEFQLCDCDWDHHRVNHPPLFGGMSICFVLFEWKCRNVGADKGLTIVNW